jgi:hypothetical protein
MTAATQAELYALWTNNHQRRTPPWHPLPPAYTSSSRAVAYLACLPEIEDEGVPALPVYDTLPTLEPWLRTLRHPQRPACVNLTAFLAPSELDITGSWRDTHVRLIRGLLAHGLPLDPCEDLYADHPLDLIHKNLRALVRQHVPPELRGTAFAFARSVHSPPMLAINVLFIGQPHLSCAIAHLK